MKNRISVETGKARFPVARDLYGLFFEDINRSGDGGLYPEMIRNRSFEDSLTPAGAHTDPEQIVFINRGGWPGSFNHGEGMDDWAARVPYTPIPGWYVSNAVMELEQKDTLNHNRAASLRVHFAKDGTLWNIGYTGVPINTNDGYVLYAFIKTTSDVTLTATLAGKDGEDYGSSSFPIKGSADWQRVDYTLTATGEDYNGIVRFSVNQSCEILFGFTSLMPQKTFKGHGLRVDLAEMLQNSHPKFMRFPGGCVVEGFSEETAMRFSHTIGPVWERPSHNLMWHYRTSNGLGFHEYLQFCEDIGMEPMYVCNCGMSCQARVGEFFNDTVVDEFLQEALHALEYALGSIDTPYGAMRAAAGHPAPFRMKYFEIGNENNGPEYFKRYEKFYQVLKAAYPDVIFISNSHTEQQGLPTEFVDEHFYSTPEFFMENADRFNTYDRNGPEIFIGEYAVNGGNTIASMECALAEAVFLTGVERNQDIVKLTAYAPLLHNVNYTAWKPNLIAFDNHRVYGIPSYHAISLMAKNRGEYVIESTGDVASRPPVYSGIPGLMCGKPGLQFQNAKINGQPVDISRTIYGDWSEKDGVYTMQDLPRPHPHTGKSEAWNKAFEAFRSRGRGPTRNQNSNMWVAFGTEDLEEYTFEIDLKFDKETPVTLSIWNYRPNTDAGCDEPKDPDWNMFSVRNQIWKIENGCGTTEAPRFMSSDSSDFPKTALAIDYSKINTYKIVASKIGYDCYINNVLVQIKRHIQHPVFFHVATADEDTVILKLVHVGSEPADVEIDLDCDVKADAEVEILSAAMDDVNSLDDPAHVSVKDTQIHNAAKHFTFNAGAYSVNVLKLKKIHSKDR